MDTRTVTTVGRGTAKAAPDGVAVVLTLEVEGGTPAEALRECGAAQRLVLEALGVPASAAGLSVQPGWDHERQREGRPRAVSTVSATLPDLSAAGAVVTSALEAGGRAVRLQHLAPVVTDSAAAQAAARQEAYRDAHRSAEQYAALAGVRLGALVTLSEVVGKEGPGGPHRTSGLAAMEVSYQVADGPQDVGASLVGTWELLAD